MPRPKPPEPLRFRQVRIPDSVWQGIKERGGAAWLRAHLSREFKTRPEGYWTVFQKEKHHA